ncbi:MAG: efflux RND transporter permease subunit [Thermodesulfobacteriota bacterium]
MVFILRHPVAVVAIFVGLVLGGALALPFLPIDLLPSLKHPRLLVLTSLENASAEEIESLLTRQVEEAVGTVSGVKRMTSTSTQGVSCVSLLFDWGSPMASAASEVREKLDLIADQLPREAKLPIVIQYDPTEAPILTMALSGSVDLVTLRTFAANNLKNELETVNGVAHVRLRGGLSREIAVWIDRGRMAAHKVDLLAVARRLETANINFPGGQILDGPVQIPIRTVGRFQSLDEMRSVSLGRGTMGGSVTVADVAQVKDWHKSVSSICRVNGQSAVLLGIIKEPAANTIEVTARVLDKFRELEPRLPQGTRLDVVDNEAPFIENALKDLRNQIIIGSLLAFVVLWAGIRALSTAGIIILAIPVCVLSTFAFMRFFSINLNLMSIGGMALGVGMLVDNSIVVLEVINRKRNSAHDMFQGVATAVKEVFPSITAGTITTLAVLLPISFMSGFAQRLFRDFAFTLAVSLLLSLLTAVILVPTIAHWTSRFGKGLGVSSGPPPGLEQSYARLLRIALKHRWIVVALSVTAFTLALLLVYRTGFELLPDVNTGQFRIVLTLPEDSSFERVQKAVDSVERLVAATPGVKSFVTEAGSERGGSGSTIESAIQVERTNQARINVTLEPEFSGTERRRAIIQDLRSRTGSVQDAHVEFVFRGGPLAKAFGDRGSPEVMTLVGDDLLVLSKLGRSIQEALQKTGTFSDLRCTGIVWTKQLKVMIDRYQAAARNLTVEDIAQTIRTAIQGKIVGKFIESDSETDIRVRLSTGENTTIHELQQVPMLVRGGDELVLLGQLASTEPGRGPLEIVRTDQRRSLVFHANVVGTSFSRGEEQALAASRSVELPSGYELRSGMEKSELISSLSDLAWAIGLAVLLVYVVLVVQYESLLWPLVVFSSIPMAIVGPSLALTLAGGFINIQVMIGVLVLLGIAVNNAILIVVCANQLRSAGHPLSTAIVEGSVQRFRPILMTTLTTVFGALPVCLAWGGAAPLNRPLALTVGSGLVASTVFTLFLVPVVYSLVARFATGGPRDSSPGD